MLATTDCSYIAVVPDGIQNSNVAIQRREKDVVGWRRDKIPERLSGNPEVTNEEVTHALAWHSSAVHHHNSGQQRHERRTYVYDALVNYENAHRLHKTRNLSVGLDAIGERYSLNHAIVVKFYHAYTQVPVTFADIIIIIAPNKYSYLLTYLLTYLLIY